METLYQQFKDQGFIVVTMLDSGTAMAWTTMHSLTYPTVEVSTAEASAFWTNFTAYPTINLLSPGMVVHTVDKWPAPTAADIEAILP